MNAHISRRFAQVARPGVVVSTIVLDHERVETVTFSRDASTLPGFTTKVQHSDRVSDAEAMQALAVAVAR